MVQIGTISILGSQASRESEAFNNAIYNLKWYSYLVTDEKIILIFLMATQREIKFNGCKFFVLSNETFLKVSTNMFLQGLIREPI